MKIMMLYKTIPRHKPVVKICFAWALSVKTREIEVNDGRNNGTSETKTNKTVNEKVKVTV